MIQLLEVKMRLNPGVDAPAYQTPNSSGIDLKSNDDDFYLFPMERKLVHTGVFMEIPEGYEGQVRPRSGLAIKHGITVLNSPGTIDSDYRGEICVILYNTNKLGSDPYPVKKGDRIAQMVFAPIVQAMFTLVSNLSDTERGKNGFGHTGK